MIRWMRVLAIGFVLVWGQLGVAQQGPPGHPPIREEMPPAAGSQAAQVPDELVVGGKVVGRRVEPRPEDFCLVCYQRVHAGDVVYLVQGQRVPVHLGQCDKMLRAEPGRWLALLKPGGAFISDKGDQLALSVYWFFVGLYILLGVIFAGACGHQAVQKALPPIPWFFAGLFLNAVGYLILVTRPSGQPSLPQGIPEGLRKVPRTHSFAECPQCGFHNHPAAQTCLGCGAAMTPSFESEAERWRRQRPQ